MSENTERLDAIQKRLGAAEPGPWFLDADGVSIYYVFHNGDTLDRDRLAESSGADAQFIAAAPSDVAFLLDLARKLQTALDELTYVADNKASDNMIGRWWAGVIKGVIHSHMNPAPTLEAKP